MPSNLSSIRGSQPGIWLETLLRIARGMGPDRPFQSGITSMLRTLSEKLSFYRAHLVLFDPETGLLRLSLADAQPKSNHANYAPGVGVTGHVFATGQPVIVKKMKGDPLFLSLLFERTEKELEELSFISVPIFAPSQKNSMSAREVIGTLNADTMYVSDADLELRRLFLETAAALIANESAFLRENSGRYKAGSLQTGTKETALRNANEIFAVQAKTMDGILKHAQATVSGNMPVLISGEPGVGKKTLAVWIHYSGSRKDSPFIVCSCLGLTKDNALTELCGYQKSAFLGAMHTQKGLFEQANTGTIYLDAVDMLPEERRTLCAV